VGQQIQEALNFGGIRGLQPNVQRNAKDVSLIQRSPDERFRAGSLPQFEQQGIQSGDGRSSSAESPGEPVVAETERAGTRAMASSSTVTTAVGRLTTPAGAASVMGSASAVGRLTTAAGAAVRTSDWWTRSPAATSTGKGLVSGVL
jgi:hypothetical protein